MLELRECAICFDKMNPLVDSCVTLDCHDTHCFHTSCLQTWKKQRQGRTVRRTRATCPLCRTFVSSLKQQNTKKHVTMAFHNILIASLALTLFYCITRSLEEPADPACVILLFTQLVYASFKCLVYGTNQYAYLKNYIK